MLIQTLSSSQIKWDKLINVDYHFQRYAGQASPTQLYSEHLRHICRVTSWAARQRAAKLQDFAELQLFHPRTFQLYQQWIFKLPPLVPPRPPTLDTHPLQRLVTGWVKKANATRRRRQDIRDRYPSNRTAAQQVRRYLLFTVRVALTRVSYVYRKSFKLPLSKPAREQK